MLKSSSKPFIWDEVVAQLMSGAFNYVLAKALNFKITTCMLNVNTAIILPYSYFESSVIISLMML